MPLGGGGFCCSILRLVIPSARKGLKANCSGWWIFRLVPASVRFRAAQSGLWRGRDDSWKKYKANLQKMIYVCLWNLTLPDNQLLRGVKISHSQLPRKKAATERNSLSSASFPSRQNFSREINSLLLLREASRQRGNIDRKVWNKKSHEKCSNLFISSQFIWEKMNLRPGPRLKTSHSLSCSIFRNEKLKTLKRPIKVLNTFFMFRSVFHSSSYLITLWVSKFNAWKQQEIIKRR